MSKEIGLSTNTYSYADGRGSEGLTQMVESDIVSVVVNLITLQTDLDAAGVAGIFEKPTVRPLGVI